METIVDILGLTVKIDTVLTDGILIGALEESKIVEVKIVESKTKVDKIGELATDVLKTVVATISITDDTNSIEDEGVYNSVDEVEVTSIIDVCS